VKEKLRKISVLGAGSWGTTLAIILSKNRNLKITLWSVFEEQVKRILITRENKDFLPSVKIPLRIEVTSNLKIGLASKLLILAIPVQYLRSVLKKIKKENLNLKEKIFLTTAKGVEIDTFKTPTQIIKEELKVKKIAVLSGPTIAKEVIKGLPTVATVASKDEKISLAIQNVFKGTNLRIYRSQDIKGVELAGALKNIIAIASGVADGLSLGVNAKASLVVRGIVEIIRLAKKLKAYPETFWGVSGLGDLVTTCFSTYSRNRFVGEEIGKGKKLKDILKKMKMVAEGVTTVKAIYELSKRLKVDMPITKEVYLLLYKDKNPYQAVRDLMKRPFKSE